MGAIPSRDTKPELEVRRALHRLGLRYRLHARDLPGTPDIVLSRHRVVVQVHGCFWHAHGCLKRQPGPEEWRLKLARNQERDASNKQRLLDAGWRVVTVWECGLESAGADEVARLLRSWILKRRSHS